MDRVYSNKKQQLRIPHEGSKVNYSVVDKDLRFEDKDKNLKSEDKDL